MARRWKWSPWNNDGRRGPDGDAAASSSLLRNDFSTPLRKGNQGTSESHHFGLHNPEREKGLWASSGPTRSHRERGGSSGQERPGFPCMDRPFRRRARIGKLTCPWFVTSGVPDAPPLADSHTVPPFPPSSPPPPSSPREFRAFFSYGREFSYENEKSRNAFGGKTVFLPRKDAGGKK